MALALQLAAAGLTVLLTRALGLHPGVLGLALTCGALAALLTYFAGLARWWLWIQAGFAPVLVLALGLGIPPWIFLLGFLVLLAVYWSTFRTQVPLYLSSDKVWHAIETLLPPAAPQQSLRFIDLGSGLGGVLTHLARVRPEGRYFGVESAPLPWLWSWLRIKLGGHSQCKVSWGSLWDCQLNEYDVVFAYLSPVPMQQLWQKARTEMRPGSLFISSTFAVPEQSPHQRIEINDLHRSSLLLWRM
jgi:hypothetical protein